MSKYAPRAWRAIQGDITGYEGVLFSDGSYFVRSSDGCIAYIEGKAVRGIDAFKFYRNKPGFEWTDGGEK